ncbi:transglycosylase SLT domain-containing protein [Clostridium botulinum]|uniref:NlpC/P60 family protein n=1 Tax=Clostridium botulinum TaxID=1491 RepID=UPI001375AF5A|nr:NlpC/P60 family protein [Clostridium botulinum]NCI35912.1 transglycosylase SLT domain-containing protein [Clostridium botulinum]NCI71769.1 transglycosylase SLT domain-containing protein [Clostridium botulinum]
MNNLDQVNKLQKEVEKSSGNSKRKYDEDYANSIEAKVKNLKHAWEEFYQSLISSDALKAIIETGTKLVGVVDALVNSSGGMKLSLLVLLPTTILLAKRFKDFFNVLKDGKNLYSISTAFKTLFNITDAGLPSISKLKGAFSNLGTVLLNLVTTPTGLIFLGIATAVGVATAAVIKHIKHQSEMREENKKLKQSYEDLTKAMKENNKEAIKNASEDPKKAQDELQGLMKKREELKKMMEGSPNMKDGASLGVANQLKETETRIQELKKALKDNNFTIDEATGKIVDLAKASTQIANSDVAEAIKETAEFELKEKDSIIALSDEYNKLSSIKNKNKSQEMELSNVSEKLNERVQGLVLTKDKEGNVIIENTGLLDKEVEMLQTEGITVEKLTKVKLESAKEHAQIQRGMTKITYEEARKRILLLDEEIRKRQPLADAFDKAIPTSKLTGSNLFQKSIDSFRSEKIEIEKDMARLDSIYNQPSSMNTDKAPDFNPIDPEKEKKSTDALKENTGETDKNREAVNKAKEAVKQYELALKSLEIQMTKNNITLGRLYEHSDSYINKLKEKQNLIKQEIELNKQQIAMNGQLANSLGAVGGSYVNGMGNSIGEQVVRNAQQYLGKPYKWGGSNPSESFDCSGLVQYVYKQVGIQLNRTTYDQVKQGTPVAKNQLQVGDAVFFGSPSAPHHVGIYMGNGQYIHAPKTGDVIKVSSLSSRSDYATARRYASSGTSYSRTTASNYNGKYASYINEAAAKYGVSAALIAAIIKQESDFNPNARSREGAMGLMQLMPVNAREFGISNPYDPRQSIMGGTQEIAKYLKKYNGNLDLALAAYNAGMGAVQKYGGVPPYKETKDYIPKVKKYMKEYGGSESSIHSTIDEQMDLIGKSMDMEKKNLELQEELNKINIQILEARLGQFDDKVKSIDRTITQLRTDVDLQNKNDINYINYLSKIDDYTVKKLDTLKKERDFIKKEISSGIYDEKTIKMLGEKYSDIGTEMLNVTKTIKDVSLELVTAKWEAIQQIYKENIEMISNELDRLSLHEEKNIKQIMILKKQLVEQDEANIKRMTELIRETNDIAYKYGKDFLLDKVREYTAELDKANTELEKHKKELEDIKDKMSEMKSTIEDKLREILTKTAELAKEQLDKVLKHFEETIDAELKKLDEAEKRNSYNEQKTEQLKTIAELQEKIAKLATDDSEEGIARRLEYEKQLQEEMKKKTDLQMKHNNELKKEALTKQKEEKKKEIEKKKRDIDTRLDNVYLNLDARKALTEGYIEWIDGKRIGIQNALLQFEDLFGKGLTSLGDKIKKELLEQLKAAQDLVNGIDKKDPDKILEENKTKNVYGTGADLANARKILGSLGYNYIDTSLVDKNKLHFGKDDIVVGDTGAINGVDRQDLNGAIRLGGKNRYDTAGIIQLYSDIQSGRIKPIGGVVYGTGQDLKNAIAWLSPLGYEFVDTSKINPKDINFNPNDIIVGGKGAKGGVNFDVDGITRLGGNDRNDTYNKIRDKALIDLNAMNKSNYVPKSKYGKVYGTGYDLKAAKKYLTKLGYQFVDTKSVRDVELTANDIVVGGTMDGKEQIYNSQARWLFGKDRYQTESEIANYANTMSDIRGYYDKGGVADFTGKAMLHGNPSAVETIFNAEQGKKLYNFVNALPMNNFGYGMNKNLQPAMSTNNNNNITLNFKVEKMYGTENEAKGFATTIINTLKNRGKI